MNENEPAIYAAALTRFFGKVCAVNKVDFEIHYQTIFGLLGPNGAGKTTIIKMLTTLLAPTSGTATVCGFDIIKEPSLVRSHIGYVPQLLSADGSLTAYENLVLLARLYGLSKNERKSRIQEMLDLMELSPFADKLVKEYSGGMIRRLEIALALLHRPGVLFLDEPTIGLDPIARQTVWDRLLSLKENLKLAVLITTHDMEEADYLCDELAMIQHGDIIIQGKTIDLKKSVGQDASMYDVFTHYCGGMIETGGDYQDAKNVRKNIHRLS